MKAPVLQAACGSAGNDSVPVVMDRAAGLGQLLNLMSEAALQLVVIICFSMRFGLYQRFAYIKCICETHYIKLIMEQLSMFYAASFVCFSVSAKNITQCDDGLTSALHYFLPC